MIERMLNKSRFCSPLTTENIIVKIRVIPEFFFKPVTRYQIFDLLLFGHISSVDQISGWITGYCISKNKFCQIFLLAIQLGLIRRSLSLFIGPSVRAY